MRGHIEHFDPGQRAGFIIGEDGARYDFREMDLPNIYELPQGTPVEFVPVATAATQISANGAPPAAAPHPAAPAYQSASGPTNYPPHVANRPLFENFKLCMTDRYAKFTGRAGRREYWSFVLFLFVVSIVVGFVAGFTDGANFLAGEPTLLATGASWLLFFVFICPYMALAFRRLHDFGLMGWLAIFTLIPIFGALWGIIIGLIPTKPTPNIYGHGPE